LVERAQQSAGSTGPWAVVFGSDRTLPEAKVEIDRAAKLGVTGSGIYFRNGYYASIALAENRDQAAKYLATTKTFRPDAYITRMATWCKDPRPQAGFIECASTK
jgi:hypothetical protein